VLNTQNKLKIAIIVSSIEEAGPVKVIQNLVNSLRDADNLKISVFYIDKSVDLTVRMSVPVSRLDRRNFRFSDFDIIHTNGLRPDLFAFLNRKKIHYHISTLHNFVFEDLEFTYDRIISGIFGNIWLLIWKSADKLICVSESMKDYYSRWFPEQKLNVIYNGISEIDNSIRSYPDIVQAIGNFRLRGLIVLGCAGILTKRKGIDLVLDLLAKEGKYALVIIGDGKELPDLIRLSKTSGISDRCLFCGFRSNAVQYFKHFDFFIMPSRSEGFGLALVEAVQQKVPVICSDIDVFQELFTAEEVTFFKPGEWSSLSKSLKIGIEKGKKKAGLAYTRFLNNYMAHLMAEQYYKLYKNSISIQGN
jgi:glycosyltransferase involved in cell wall biosynthesis